RCAWRSLSAEARHIILNPGDWFAAEHHARFTLPWRGRVGSDPGLNPGELPGWGDPGSPPPGSRASRARRPPPPPGRAETAAAPAAYPAPGGGVAYRGVAGVP